jgi:hypothetical protein
MRNEYGFALVHSWTTADPKIIDHALSADALQAL